MHDIHSHIIYGVDDGAENIQESLEMIKQAAAEEIEAIIATPHYIEGLYVNEYDDNLIRLNMIKEEADKAGINIKLYLGNEVRITPELSKLIKSKKIAALNNSRYFLIELPFLDIPVYTEKVLFDFGIEGYKVIFAHPERNQCIINDLNILYRLIKLGAFVQMNILSFEGKYGKRIKRTAQLMLQHGMVHFIGTDSHSALKGQTDMKDLAKRLSYYSRDKLSDLFYDNPAQIIKNELIKINEPEKVKYQFFKKLYLG